MAALVADGDEEDTETFAITSILHYAANNMIVHHDTSYTSRSLHPPIGNVPAIDIASRFIESKQSIRSSIDAIPLAMDQCKDWMP